jgi:Tol biopolymer transport system component
VDFYSCPGRLPFASFEASVDGYSSPYRIRVVNPDGSENRQVSTNNAGSEINPDFSPDGRYIVYSRQESGDDYDLVVVEVSSGDEMII